MLLIFLLSVKMPSLSLKTFVKRAERKLKKETRKNQKLIKSQLKLLIYLNKNVCLKELCQVLEIILMILDQEIRSSKNSNVTSAVTFIFIESATTCFHLLFMKI